jgi:hypothetical protein
VAVIYASFVVVVAAILVCAARVCGNECREYRQRDAENGFHYLIPDFGVTWRSQNSTNEMLGRHPLTG